MFVSKMKATVMSVSSVAVLIFAAAASAQQEANTGTQEPSNAEIAGTLETTNELERKMADLAQNKAQNDQIKMFAKQIETDHKLAQQRASELFKKLEIQPKGYDTSKKLEQEAKQSMERLQGLSGEAFDKAFLQTQIEMHEKVLELIDSRFMTATKNKEMLDYIGNFRLKIAAHSRQAKTLQSKLQ